MIKKTINYIRNFKKSELIRGSLILIIMLGIFNFLNYIFQMSMARLLGPADYGILAVLLSFIYILSIPSEAIQTIVSKYTSKSNVKYDFGEMKDLLYRGIRKGILISLVVFIIFLLTSFWFSKFLNIQFWLIALTGITIFYVFTIPLLRGIIQGRKNFLGLGINLIIESLIKVVLSLFFVWIGFKVYGAITGILLAFIATFILAFVHIKEVIKSKRKRVEFKNIYYNNVPVLISLTSIILIYSLDIILARRFFSPEIAGQYAFVSLIGKIILFSSSAIGKAMFPISSENFEKGNKDNILKKAIMIVLIISAVFLAFYFFFPELIIKLISLGSESYLAASNILFILGLAFSFLSISNILILHNISKNKMKNSSIFLILFVILEIIMLSLFNSNLIEFSLSLLVINFIMLCYLIIITLIKK